MPGSLFGRECTPQEVAAAQRPERESQYLDALRDRHLPTGYVEDHEAGDNNDLEFYEVRPSMN